MITEENLEYKNKTLNELLTIAEGDVVYPKLYALISLIRNYHDNNKVITDILRIINDKTNLNTNFMGNIKVSWVGIIALLETDNKELKKLARDIIDSLNNVDRKDLLWYLNSEKISIK